MPENRPLMPPLLALTFVTGIVDAVCFLGLGQVFAAMQTGNVIFLGFGIAGASEAPAVAPAVGLGAFLLGGAAAWLVKSASAEPQSQRDFHLALAIEVLLLGCAALLAALTEVSPGALSAYALIAALSFAMGLRNTVARGIGGPNLATTVLNLTLTSVTPLSPAKAASGGDLAERGISLIAILLGAVAGALLLKTSLVLPILAAAAVTLIAALTHILARADPAAPPAGR